MLAALILVSGAVLVLAGTTTYVIWAWWVEHAKNLLLAGYLVDERERNNGHVNEPCDLREDAIA